LTYGFVRTHLDDRSAFTDAIRGSIPLNMHPAGSLGVVYASNATSRGYGAPAGGYQNSAAAESVLATHGIDQHNIARVYVVLQTEVEAAHREATGSSVPGDIRSRASDCGCPYWERLA
jgi:hypothetical protein